MSAEQALSASESNKKKRVEYYLNNIEKDRKTKIIKGKIEKAVAKGETWVSVVFLFHVNEERTIAIEKYFKDLGYDISFCNDRCEISLRERHRTPRPKNYVKR